MKTGLFSVYTHFTHVVFKLFFFSCILLEISAGWAMTFVTSCSALCLCVLRISQYFVLTQQSCFFYLCDQSLIHPLHSIVIFVEFFQKSVLPLSSHLFFFHPLGYESFPQSCSSLCSSQTSRTSAVSVSDLHSCVEQLWHKLSHSQQPDTLSLSLAFSSSLSFLASSLSPSPPFSPTKLSFSSSVFSSKGRLPSFHRPGLIFYFQVTVAHSCFTSLLSLALAFFYVLRDKHNRGKQRQNGHVDI